LARHLTVETRKQVLPGKLVYAPVNAHIYENHLDRAKGHILDYWEMRPMVEKPVRFIIQENDPLGELLVGVNPVRSIDAAREYFYAKAVPATTTSGGFQLNA
jgi:hypothetical protein